MRPRHPILIPKWGEGAASVQTGTVKYESSFNIAKRALTALKNGQPAQSVEQIKEAAVVGGDVVALDAL